MFDPSKSLDHVYRIQYLNTVAKERGEKQLQSVWTVNHQLFNVKQLIKLHCDPDLDKMSISKLANVANELLRNEPDYKVYQHFCWKRMVKQVSFVSLRLFDRYIVPRILNFGPVPRMIDLARQQQENKEHVSQNHLYQIDHLVDICQMVNPNFDSLQVWHQVKDLEQVGKVVQVQEKYFCTLTVFKELCNQQDNSLSSVQSARIQAEIDLVRMETQEYQKQLPIKVEKLIQVDTDLKINVQKRRSQLICELYDRISHQTDNTSPVELAKLIRETL